MYTSSSVDSEGRSLISSNAISDISYHDISISFFANPGSSFTGYAADGLKRNAGAVDDTDQASWASESASASRGDADGFPDRVFFIANGNSISVLNADDLTVWMRFNYASAVKQCVFSEGYLVVRFETEVWIYSFVKDLFWKFSNTNTVQYSDVSTRNSPSGGTNGLVGSRLQSNQPQDVDVKKVGSNWYVGVGEFVGLTAINISSFNIASSTVNQHSFFLSYTFDTSVHTNASITSTSLTQNSPFSGSRTDFSTIALYGDRFQMTSPQSTDTSIRVISGGLGQINYEDVNNELTAATETSVSFKILKPCRLVAIQDDGAVIYSAGHSFYRSIDWVTGSIDLLSDKKASPSSNYDHVSPFLDKHDTGNLIRVATSNGVAVVSKDTIENELVYSLLYSDLPEGVYSTMFSSSVRPTSCVTTDPENGNVLFSTGNLIYEVSSADDTHRIVRTIDVGYTVSSVFGFRNLENELDV